MSEPVDILSYMLPSKFDWKAQSLADPNNDADFWSHVVMRKLHRHYMVKWNPRAYSIVTWGASNIYITEDRDGKSWVRYHNGHVWAKRWMAAGDSFVNDSQMQEYDLNCNLLRDVKLHRVVTLLERTDRDYGGDVGTTDAIILAQKLDTLTEEHYHYGKGWGLLRWEWWAKGAMTMFSRKNKVVEGRRTPDTTLRCAE